MENRIMLILILNMSLLNHIIAGSGPCNKLHSQQMISFTGVQGSGGHTISGNITMDQCSESCINNCSCVAAFYNNNSSLCRHATEVSSSSLVQSDDRSVVAFFKIDSPAMEDGLKKKGMTFVLFVIALCLFTLVGVVCLAVFFLFGTKQGRRWGLGESTTSGDRNPAKGKNVRDEVLKIIAHNFVKLFPLKELEAATSEFSMILGKGGFGNVYLGKLSDQSEIAVKKMEPWGQGDHEFCTEVSIIGLLHHRNLLQLRGYCADQKQRMLVYEYMPNGSLDEWLFNKKGRKVQSQREHLPWSTRVKIIVGIARGLAYLHHECRRPIVHLDIKPENVLLDKDFVPKLSDFGFSKVMNSDSIVYSNARGTPGYMAPEWLMESTVSSKSDVYSFGMVLLEIVGGRRNHDPSKEGQEDVYYPCWAMAKLEEGMTRDVIDERIREVEGISNEVVAQADTLLKVGLSCIQKSVGVRPAVDHVLNMLEGLLPPPSSESLSSIYVYPCGEKRNGQTRTLHSTIMSINRVEFESQPNSLLASPISAQDRW
ncbi:hypothetical protein SUGI_0000530 [Cryptomeria japonica]|uniref:G-type lectin S-receptor-like serine/threonine-protein kinase SD2-5 n=1 Tax=Cryptomeria japonica TaxID=3369 RepID=UPI002408C014|nr:G-type lectin S-receptor-like serine/threonine-protein kinase SD2-5 [Cryptomeria japonica]GLJ04647.1 hypothetical protein SUGI_0000530 [Cryptomeria japonica]